MTELTVLNGAAIQSLLTIPMAVRAVEQAYLEKSTGGAALWPMVFHEFTPGAADLDIKSGHMNGLGLYGMKVVSWFGDNPAKDLPALYGTSLLFDIHTGAPRALLNAGPITDFRTGAAGAVGAKYLARPDAGTLLMAGTGALAPYLIAAALYCLPQLKTVYVANPHHPERSAAACAAIRIERMRSIVWRFLHRQGERTGSRPGGASGLSAKAPAGQAPTQLRHRVQRLASTRMAPRGEPAPCGRGMTAAPDATSCAGAWRIRWSSARSSVARFCGRAANCAWMLGTAPVGRGDASKASSSRASAVCSKRSRAPVCPMPCSRVSVSCIWPWRAWR